MTHLHRLWACILPILWLYSLALPPPAQAQQWLPGGEGSPIVCAYNSVAPTPAAGFVYAQCDLNGNIITSGGGGGGSSGAVYPSGGAAGSSNGLGGVDTNAFTTSFSGPAATGYSDPAGCPRPANPGSQFYITCLINLLNSPILMPINITEHNCSVTLTTGGTAQNAFVANAAIHGFRIQNSDTAHIEDVWWSTTTTAAANTAQSFRLAAAPAANSTVQAASYTSPAGEGVNSALSVIAATTSHLIQCTYW